jgi:hypothetical protein
MVQEHLVVTVRADGRRDLALVLLFARPEPENHHAAIEARAPGRRLTPPPLGRAERPGPLGAPEVISDALNTEG